jgi:hypothetical protein
MQYLIDFQFFFFAVLYNAENCSIWKIYSVPCDSALDKFYCIFFQKESVLKMTDSNAISKYGCLYV